MRLFLPRLGFAIFALTSVALGADIAKPSSKPTPVVAKKPAEPPATLANLLAMPEDMLAKVDLAAMFLCAGQGLMTHGKKIDLKAGMDQIEQIAFVYGERGLDSEDHGGQTDRGKVVWLLKWMKENPPVTPLPLGVILVSVGRKLGMPMCLAQTPKGVMVCMQSPEQDTFIDTEENDAHFWTIEGDSPRQKLEIEQAGKMPGDAPKLKHYLFRPRDELAVAIASRGDLLRGILRNIDDKTGKLGVDTPNGAKQMTPQEWRDLNKQALVAYTQAQLCSPKIRFDAQIESTVRVAVDGYIGALQVGWPWIGMRIKPDKPFDDKTPAGRVLPYEKLLEMSSEELAKQDIAEVNLACADGLPGSEKIDVPAALAAIDSWAQLVHFQIKRNHRIFDNVPSDFGFSENRYKAYVMAMTLKEDVGIHYNPSIAEQYDPKELEKKYPGIPIGPDLLEYAMSQSKSADDSRNKFITGMLGKDKFGTCTSMPVLYAAVGRRLSMPIKIVTTAGHAFARWDDGKEKFNIEITDGFEIHDDEFYKSWPLKVSPFDMEDGGFLKSLTPPEELAFFLKNRAAVLDAHGRVLEGLLAIAQANLFRPKLEATRGQLQYFARRYFDRPRLANNQPE